jgi:hypothetical protein
LSVKKGRVAFTSNGGQVSIILAAIKNIIVFLSRLSEKRFGFSDVENRGQEHNYFFYNLKRFFLESCPAGVKHAELLVIFNIKV